MTDARTVPISARARQRGIGVIDAMLAAVLASISVAAASWAWTQSIQTQQNTALGAWLSQVGTAAAAYVQSSAVAGSGGSFKIGATTLANGASNNTAITIASLIAAGDLPKNFSPKPPTSAAQPLIAIRNEAGFGIGILVLSQDAQPLARFSGLSQSGFRLVANTATGFRNAAGSISGAATQYGISLSPVAGQFDPGWFGYVAIPPYQGPCVAVWKNSVGGIYTLTVPSCAKAAVVQLAGAGGIGYNSYPGGSGDLMNVQLPVTAGQSLTVVIGGRAGSTSSTGYGGGSTEICSGTS